MRRPKKSPYCELTEVDHACHAICRHINGSRSCKCAERMQRPCESVERIFKHIAVVTRNLDKELRAAKRRETIRLKKEKANG